ncbi:DUF262 domain-containing protein [Lactococcus lactis]|uniref:DUF262 domain-containing protein n=1 Tax=Lactococcus lactis TaxID=1358 RepID=UPI001CC32477|nr:DUF262 domain-containing protein [Lactococcus lactis]
MINIINSKEDIHNMISDKLRDATSYDPTKQSQSRTIAQLNEEIERKKISLPIYQRDLSWTLQKAVDLFDYQLYGKAPVAPLSLNRISLDDDFSVTQVEVITRQIIKEDDVKEGQLSIIDGQQRLTTNYKAYIDDPSFTNIVLDIKKGQFRIIKNAPTKFQIPVGKLLNKSQEYMMRYIQDVMKMESFPEVTTLIAIRTKMLQYSYTLHIANEMNETEQIEWFEVLNNAGSKVSALQMTFAKLGSKQNFDIYAQYGEPFKKLIEDFDLNNLFSPYTTNVSYPVALLNPELELLTVDYKGHKNNYAPIPSDTKEKLLINLSIADLDKITSNSLNSLEKALNFFESYDLSEMITRMDYILYISGYISFKGLHNEKIPKLIEWVKEVDFSNLDNTKRRILFTELLNI